MQEHTLLVPRAADGPGVSVYWYKAEDGHCYGYEFWLTTPPKIRIRLFTLARRMASHGPLSIAGEHGHYLKGDFTKIYELKPQKFRFMAFRWDNHFYITNGAPKASSDKKQTPDWRRALMLRDEFFEQFS